MYITVKMYCKRKGLPENPLKMYHQAVQQLNAKKLIKK